MTRAPVRAASCVAKLPTPPAAPTITTVCTALGADGVDEGERGRPGSPEPGRVGMAERCGLGPQALPFAVVANSASVPSPKYGLVERP